MGLPFKDFRRFLGLETYEERRERHHQYMKEMMKGTFGGYGVSNMGEQKFKVGDKVRLKKSSRYYGDGRNQLNQFEGTVSEFNPRDSLRYQVEWVDDTGEKHRNSYGDDDLEVGEMVKKKEPAVVIKYKPGTSITDYVKTLIGKETDKDRLKQLRTFDSCVLPDHVKETIEEALTIVLMAHKFDEWGINENFEKGLTNSILLYGPPGTGKTMISESIAAVLGKNLMKVSTGDINSNIPGQTERNIVEIFSRAKKENAVLMFDECDSVLSDRNKVGIILGAEINALLTEIERFDGVVVLTTNRLHRLDPALQRRILARIKLDPPEQTERKQIWKNLMPKKMPVHSDVDIEKLSEFRLTGGQIKNCILVAARKAIAKNMDKVEMLHFAKAIRNELGASQDFDDASPAQLHVQHSEVAEDYDKVRGKP